MMLQEQRKPQILVVDDHPHNLRVAVGLLEEHGYECALAVSGLGAIEFAEAEQPDLILLDVMMPELDGYEVCTRLKANPATSAIPIIFLTAKAASDDLVRGFSVGAVDYVTKPFNRLELLARVGVHVELKRSRDALQRYMAQLEEASRTDPLTGLANRRYLILRLQEEMARFARTGRPFSVVLLDVDNFKSINDTYGHAWGDEVLLALAELLKGGLRVHDLPGRWGGEEFLLLLPESDAAAGRLVAERVRGQFAVHDGAPVQATVTCGGATARPGQSVDDLIRQADAALYAGKAAGKNQTLWYG